MDIANTEKAVFVGIVKQNEDERKIVEYLDELEFLAETAGAIGDRKFIQKLDKPEKATYIRSGKLEEIASYCEDNEIEYVIFDDELTGMQQRNIEKVISCSHIIDRTSLILEIFAQRAKTSYAKMQVELARYNYMLPRLAGMWTHLERQRGGIGTRGPGEKKLEIDRRLIRDRISELREDLDDVVRSRDVTRAARTKAGIPIAAIVGYTNAGKSTLLNKMTGASVLEENKLFATLDTTVRKVVIENLPFLLTDTVGFIRKLPHHLVESFKSTLDEVREADLLMHIVDISHPNFEEQYEVVQQTIADLGVNQLPTIVVFNKTDAFTYTPKDEDDLTPVRRENISLEDLKKTWMAKMSNDCIFISAKNKDNIDALKELMYERIKEIHIRRYPYNDFLFQKYEE